MVRAAGDRLPPRRCRRGRDWLETVPDVDDELDVDSGTAARVALAAAGAPQAGGLDANLLDPDDVAAAAVAPARLLAHVAAPDGELALAGVDERYAAALRAADEQAAVEAFLAAAGGRQAPVADSAEITAALEAVLALCVRLTQELRPPATVAGSLAAAFDVSVFDLLTAALVAAPSVRAAMTIAAPLVDDPALTDVDRMAVLLLVQRAAAALGDDDAAAERVRPVAGELLPDGCWPDDDLGAALAALGPQPSVWLAALTVACVFVAAERDGCTVGELLELLLT